MLILKRLLTTSCTLLDTSPKNYYKIIAPSTFETKNANHITKSTRQPRLKLQQHQQQQ